MLWPCSRWRPENAKLVLGGRPISFFVRVDPCCDTTLSECLCYRDAMSITVKPSIGNHTRKRSGWATPAGMGPRSRAPPRPD